jgi:hypothetical protein
LRVYFSSTTDLTIPLFSPVHHPQSALKIHPIEQSREWLAESSEGALSDFSDQPYGATTIAPKSVDVAIDIASHQA